MRLILVGGFLGAGKTTLLGVAARHLSARGFKVGMITNDQAPDLVDTALLTRFGTNVKEVAGSCFCCNFGGFTHAVQSLADSGADCILAEPVGSCTDLSATIVHPIKRQFTDWQIAPLNVLVDPVRAREVTSSASSPLHPDASYILEKQLEEADCILLNKVDTLSESDRKQLVSALKARYPHADVIAVSALRKMGVAEWLDAALDAKGVDTRIAAVDYDRYANGESVLGWLNATVELTWIRDDEPDWETIALRLMTALGKRFHETSSEIGHIKILMNASHGQLVANRTGLHDADSFRLDGNLDESAVFLIVNARVQSSPSELEKVFRVSLEEVTKEHSSSAIRALHCIKPGRPVPTFRYSATG
ncbi:MAG: cobalamin synthesis protein P47K [Candidatus Hydrogenedentes bacterium]|nr:cobalamin synthesis protein P47K [Candidatus Hydrogenedentota bacterium]